MLGRYESEICKCGFHKSLISDKSNVFRFESETCSVCAERDRTARVLAEQDEVARKRMGDNIQPSAPDPADGRHVTVRAQLGAAGVGVE